MILLTNDHFETIKEQFDSAKKSIKIISPFLSKGVSSFLCKYAKRGIECEFITRIYINDMLHRANDLDALKEMINCGVKVYAVKGLHTKLYVFDEKSCILGSANFTNGGLKNNIELSILFDNNSDNENEKRIVADCDRYYKDMKNMIAEQPYGLVTQEEINEYKEEFVSVISTKKQEGDRYITTMYGAKLNRSAMVENLDEIKDAENEVNNIHQDVIYSLISDAYNEQKIEFNENIWMKFSGTSEHRVNPKEVYAPTEVELNGKKIFVSCFPANKRPSIKIGDYYYEAEVTYDKYGKPCVIIVGRGKFASEADEVISLWKKDYEYMSHYSIYCQVDELEIINANVESGLSLSEVWHKLLSNTYMCSFGKNETLDEVAKKHQHKSHIELSGNAKKYIDERLEELFNKYGKTIYKREN